MNRNELEKILPQRPPMLLVDEAVKNEDGTSTGSYTVRGDEFFLQGHFPDDPVVPAVILCEMACQSACVLLAEAVRGKTTLFAGMNNVKFKQPVRPKDKVTFTCAAVRSLGNFHVVSARGEVDGKLCMQGEFSFFLVDPAVQK